jgi:hypothetical protein
VFLSSLYYLTNKITPLNRFEHSFFYRFNFKEIDEEGPQQVDQICRDKTRFVQKTSFLGGLS